MYHKFLNINSGKTFVAGPTSRKHYEENKSIKYLGTCNEDGVIISFDNSPPIKEAVLDKETRRAIQNILPSKSHQIEEDFLASDERDEDS